LRARATHLDGVREAFLQHLAPADLEHLSELWERMLPGSTQT
jgi:hypothetical protein